MEVKTRCQKMEPGNQTEILMNGSNTARKQIQIIKGREGAIGVGVAWTQPLFGSCPGSHGPPWEQAERRLGVQATIGGAGRFYGWPIVNGQQVLHALPKTVRKIQIQGNIDVSWEVMINICLLLAVMTVKNIYTGTELQTDHSAFAPYIPYTYKEATYWLSPCTSSQISYKVTEKKNRNSCSSLDETRKCEREIVRKITSTLGKVSFQ